MALVAGLMLYLHVAIVYCSFDRQPPLDPTRPICTGTLVFFVALGALMGRLQPNFWMGVRTPWTLTSPKVWQATHRLASRVFIVGGLVGLAIVWSNLPPAQRIIGMLAVLVAAGVVPLAHSLVYYKLLQRRGEL